MRCDEAQASWLAQQQQGAEVPGVDDHMRECAACTAFAEANRQLDALLALDDDQPVRPGFDTRFFARLEEQKRAQKRRSGTGVRGWWLWLAPVATAAFALWSFGGSGTDGAAGRVTDATPTELPQEVQAGGAPLGMQPDELEFALQLEMVEAMPVVERLDDLQALTRLDREAEVWEALESGQVDDLLDGSDTP